MGERDKERERQGERRVGLLCTGMGGVTMGQLLREGGGITRSVIQKFLLNEPGAKTCQL